MFKTGEIVLAKDKDTTEWEEVEFLKYDKDMEYGKYICIYTTHGGKGVSCYDEIKRK